MKLKLFVMVFLFTVLPVFTDTIKTFAQSHEEYIYLDDVWDNSTGHDYYNVTSCFICGKFINSYDEDDVANNLYEHIRNEHPNFVDNGNGNNGDNYNGETQTPPDNNGNVGPVVYKHTYKVVDLRMVANAMSYGSNGSIIDAYNRSNGRYYEGYWVDIENFDLFLRSYYHAQTLSMNDPRIHQYPYLALHFYGETIETKDSRYNVYFPSAGSFLPYDTPSSQSIIYTFLNHFEQ